MIILVPKCSIFIISYHNVFTKFDYLVGYVGETQENWDGGEVGHPLFLKSLIANHNQDNSDL